MTTVNTNFGDDACPHPDVVGDAKRDALDDMLALGTAEIFRVLGDSMTSGPP